MYCRKCGKEVHDEAVICIHCGCSIEEKKENDYSQSKSTLGVIMALFLGLIGLFIGLAVYPSDTNARSSFVRSWTIVYSVELITVLVFIIPILITIC